MYINIFNIYIYTHTHNFFPQVSQGVHTNVMTLRQPASAVLESNFLVEQKVINQVLLAFHARRPDRLTLMFSLWKGSTDLRDFAVEE